MTDESAHCHDCGCSVRSIAARDCRASDCPLNSANRQVAEDPIRHGPNPYGRSLDQPLDVAAPRFDGRRAAP